MNEAEFAFIAKSLSKNFLFKDISTSMLKHILENMKMHIYKAGKEVFK